MQWLPTSKLRSEQKAIISLDDKLHPNGVILVLVTSRTDSDLSVLDNQATAGKVQLPLDMC